METIPSHLDSEFATNNNYTILTKIFLIHQLTSHSKTKLTHPYQAFILRIKSSSKDVTQSFQPFTALIIRSFQ